MWNRALGVTYQSWFQMAYVKAWSFLRFFFFFFEVKCRRKNNSLKYHPIGSKALESCSRWTEYIAAFWRKMIQLEPVWFLNQHSSQRGFWAACVRFPFCLTGRWVNQKHRSHYLSSTLKMFSNSTKKEQHTLKWLISFPQFIFGLFVCRNCL